MTRLACLRVTAFSILLLAAVAGRPAEASYAVSAYVAASKVDMLPDEASATSAVIHGAFTLRQADGSYSVPQCGYMYFQCAAGSETMCRMQWNDLLTYGGLAVGTCAGFGSENVVTTAMIRAEGTALASPDSWDLGIGVSPGSSVWGQCQPARALVCPPPSGGSGAGGTTGAAGTDGAGGTTGAAGTLGPGPAGTSWEGSGAGGQAGSQVLSNRSSGCALATGARGGAVAIPIVALLGALLLRRRRR